MAVQSLLYYFFDLTGREIATLEECHPPSSPRPPAKSLFSEWEKPYILTLPQTPLPEESAFWTMNSDTEDHPSEKAFSFTSDIQRFCLFQ